MRLSSNQAFLPPETQEFADAVVPVSRKPSTGIFFTRIFTAASFLLSLVHCPRSIQRDVTPPRFILVSVS
jgi:hypothetical protein